MSTATVTHNLPIAEALVNTKPKGLVKIQVQWIPTLFSGLKAPFEKPGLGVCCRVVCSCVQALRAVSVFDPRGNLVVGMGRESCPTFPSTPPPPPSPHFQTQPKNSQKESVLPGYPLCRPKFH